MWQSYSQRQSVIKKTMCQCETLLSEVATSLHFVIAVLCILLLAVLILLVVVCIIRILWLLLARIDISQISTDMVEMRAQ